jgi:hypothetical protein
MHAPPNLCFALGTNAAVRDGSVGTFVCDIFRNNNVGDNRRPDPRYFGGQCGVRTSFFHL